MLNWSFAIAYQHTAVVGGILALICCALGVSYRLAVQHQTAENSYKKAQESPIQLVEITYVYSGALLPWLFVLFTLRSDELGLHTCSSMAVSSIVRTQLIVISVSTTLLAILTAYTGSISVNKRWSWEIVCSILGLQLCWILVAGGQTLFSILLWLEIAGLNALLLLAFSSINQLSRNALFTSWRAAHVSRQLQLGLLSTMLAFLWAGGFAVLVLLLVFSLAIGSGSSLNFSEFTIESTQGLISCSSSTVAWALLAVALLIKLMLQPFQFFLLSFYKRLTFSALSVYVSFYYVFLVPTVVFILGPGLGTLLPCWFLVLISTSIACTALLGGVLTSSVDMRSMLAFSTVVNLSILLLSLSVWS